MKKYLAVVILLWAVSAHAASSQGFSEGVAKYEAGQYREAAALFEHLLQGGGRTAAVYYNLGNAYFRLGEKGKALLSYDRALKLTPRDEDIRWNIEILKSALTDRIEDETGSILGMWVKKLLERFTEDEAAKVFSGLLLALFLLSFFSLILPRARGFFTAFQTLLAIFFIAAAVLFVLKWNEAKNSRVIVLEKETYARFGPNLKETKAFLLHEGAEGRVVDETNGWTYIVLPNKNSGWIPKEVCEKI